MNDHRTMPILPVEAYTSQEWFDREQERIFSRTWAFAGFTEDVSEPGDYLCVQAGLNSIFVVMDNDRRLRAFHNICRHRGTQLLRAVGQTKQVIVCPYHDWVYGLDGRLISVPDRERQFPGVDFDGISLKRASVDVWRGMLWVHPHEDAGPVADWFQEIEPHLGPHLVEQLPEYADARTEQVIAANWKIVVENYIDGYHLAHLHSGTLSMYDHSKIEAGFVGPHYAFWEPLAVAYGEDIEKNTPYPLVIPADQAGAWVPMLFPGIGLAENESSWTVFHVTPPCAGPDPGCHPHSAGGRFLVGLHPAGDTLIQLLGQAGPGQVRGRRRRPHGVRRLHGRRRVCLRTAAEVAVQPLFPARAVVAGRGGCAGAPGAGAGLGSIVTFTAAPNWVGPKRRNPC